MVRIRECAQGVKQGDVLGKWTIVGPPFSRGRYSWGVVAKCTCGAIKVVAVNSLASKDSKGCSGCSVGAKMHGESDTKLYRAFAGMFERCYNRNKISYKHYGERGIGVAEEWHHNFDAFREWANKAGYVDGCGLQIDRINNDEGYGPGNCRLVTARENNNNRRSTNKIEAFGEVKSIKEWWRDSRCACAYNGLRDRIAKNWDAETAITTPSAWSGYDHQLARQRDEERPVKEKAKRTAQKITNRA